MRTIVDARGRVVIPKAVRDALGLRDGSEVEVVLRDSHVEIEPATAPMTYERLGAKARLLA